MLVVIKLNYTIHPKNMMYEDINKILNTPNKGPILAAFATTIPFFITRGFWTQCFNASTKGVALVVFLGAMISIGSFGCYQ